MLYKVHASFHKDFVRVKDDEIEIGVMAKPLKGEAYEIIKKIAKHLIHLDQM